MEPQPGPAIGVIGGMGPHAGLDLARKIFDQTLASRDHDHLPVALLSYPERIPDRSTFLFDPRRESPVPAIAKIARQLEAAGAAVAGMPCNTAHAPSIFDAVTAHLDASGHRIRLVHMIRETACFVRAEFPEFQRVGVLSTSAVYHLRLYRDALEAAGLEAVVPDVDVQEYVVNPTIFDDTYGLKAEADPATPKARADLLRAIAHLHARGAQAVILGCTELPLAIPEPAVEGLPMIDPTLILARALIRETYPEKLCPLGLRVAS